MECERQVNACVRGGTEETTSAQRCGRHVLRAQGSEGCCHCDEGGLRGRRSGTTQEAGFGLFLQDPSLPCDWGAAVVSFSSSCSNAASDRRQGRQATGTPGVLGPVGRV